MKKNLSPVNVPDELLPEFIENREALMAVTGMNFSELCRKFIIDGEILDRERLSTYSIKEQLKTIDHKYVIVRF